MEPRGAQGDASPVGSRGPFTQLSDEARAASLAATLAARPGQSAGVWVFGYASLMWNPCFQHTECREALLEGYARRFCIWTALARGTPERPGLALGLEADDAACRGLTFLLKPECLEAGLTALWDREMVTGIYKPLWVALDTAEGPLSAIAFIVDPGHAQYAGRLPETRAAEIIAGARGKFGPCHEYLEQTVLSLRSAGTPDAEMERLNDRVRGLL